MDVVVHNKINVITLNFMQLLHYELIWLLFMPKTKNNCQIYIQKRKKNSGNRRFCHDYLYLTNSKR